MALCACHELFLQWQSVWRDVLWDSSDVFWDLESIVLAHWDVVVAVILCDQTHTGPVFLMVIRIIGDKLLGVCHVQPVDLDGALQGISQQKHLHLKEPMTYGVGALKQLLHTVFKNGELRFNESVYIVQYPL